MATLFRSFEAETAFQEFRKNLPHWRQEGGTYFITFRTVDSIPQSRLRHLARDKHEWLKAHPKPWSDLEFDQYRRLFEGRVQDWLDKGFGDCPLRHREAALIVATSLRHFDEVRYALDDFVVMPTHVHCLVQPFPGQSLGGILHAWKSYSSTKINKRLGKTGAFWLGESFDHIVRTAEHLSHFRAYIRANPEKAGLSSGEFILGRGSGLWVQE